LIELEFDSCTNNCRLQLDDDDGSDDDDDTNEDWNGGGGGGEIAPPSIVDATSGVLDGNNDGMKHDWGYIRRLGGLTDSANEPLKAEGSCGLSSSSSS